MRIKTTDNQVRRNNYGVKMSNLLDKICALRDLISKRQYSKLKYYKMGILQLKEEIHRQMTKKAADYSHELEFFAGDLRELAQEINQMLNEWQKIMDPDTNIKAIYEAKDGVNIDLQAYQDKVIPIMKTRTETMQALIELLNLIEYHAVYLYYLEYASNDEFAIKYSERVI